MELHYHLLERKGFKLDVGGCIGGWVWVGKALWTTEWRDERWIGRIFWGGLVDLKTKFGGGPVGLGDKCWAGAVETKFGGDDFVLGITFGFFNVFVIYYYTLNYSVVKSGSKTD